MKKIILLSTFVVILSGLFGCSERKEDTPLVQSTASVHGKGFTDVSSANFHGKFIQTKNYDLQLCQTCHGADYTGGTTSQTCMTCHFKSGGPENCGTCHGNSNTNPAPPKGLYGSTLNVGAHQKHILGSSLVGAAVSCNECHFVPTAVKNPGHIDGDGRAEVWFNANSVFHTSAAAYSSSNGTCANTYCHGNFKGGNNVTVTWNDASTTVAECGTCHGDVTQSDPDPVVNLKKKAFPKTGHTFVLVTADCSSCHREVVNASMIIIDPSKHVNGTIN